MSPNSDFKDLLNIFNAEQVRYLVVGGYAFMLYREPRYTKDLDVWVDPAAENARKVFGALARFGAPLRGITQEDFAVPGQFYQLGVAPSRVDVMTSVGGLDFASAWENRLEATFGGVPCLFIGKEDLIRNKRAVGRPQDLLDADMLEGKA